MSAIPGENAPDPVYVDSPAQLSGLAVLGTREAIGVVCLGRTDPAAVDTLSIVAGTYGPRRPDGQPSDYLYDDRVEMLRILDISAAPLAIADGGQLPIKPNFAALHHRKGSNHMAVPVFTPLIPGVEYEGMRVKGGPLVRYAISEAGILTVSRTGRDAGKKDVRLVGASQNPADHIRRLAVHSLPMAAVALRAGVSLEGAPVTSFAGYDLRVEPGQWMAPLGEYGAPALVQLNSALVIPYGGDRTGVVRMAQTLDARQQRASQR